MRSRAAASSKASAADGRPRGEHVVLDAARGAAERRGRGEVVREVGQRRGPSAAGRALERLADPQVELGAPHPGQPVVQRPPHELVGEPVGEPGRGELLDHPAADGLVERREQLGLVEAGRAADDVELELRARPWPRARAGRSFAGASRESRWLTTSRTLSGAAELGRRPREPDRPADDLDRPGLDERAPELADQERRCRSVRSRIASASSRSSGAEVAARRAAHELGHLVAGEPGEPQPDDVVGPAQVGERLRERLRHVGLGVAEGGEHEHARAAGGARQVAQQQQRRGVGPVPVLEHEQHRPSAGDAGEQVGHGRVQPVALGVRIGLDRGRQLADPGRQVGEQARELAAAGAERRPQLGRLGDPREVVERLDERPVRRAHDGVAGAVEDEGAVAPPPRRRTRGRGGSCPSPGSPPSRTTRRPSPSALGISVRSVSSSAERPTKGNVEVRRSGPGRSCMSSLTETIVRSDHSPRIGAA